LTLIHEIHLSILGLNVLIRSDSAAWIKLFARMYSRSVIGTNKQLFNPTFLFEVFTNNNNPYGKPLLIINGDVTPLKDPNLAQGFVYELILHEILRKVERYYLIHAGVVSRDGSGFLLVADTLHGKTTLVLELVRRGYAFLSDEMAPISRTNGLVYPFPRSLRIRPATLQYLGIETPPGSYSWLGKHIIDIEDIFPGSMGDPVPIAHILILRDPNYSTDNGHRLYLRFDRLPTNFMIDLDSLDCVNNLSVIKKGAYPRWRVFTSSRSETLAGVHALCNSHQVVLLESANRIDHKPDFSSAPQLEPISHSQAALSLLQHFQGGRQSALLKAESGSSPTRLLVELAGLISEAKCYNFSVGPLDEMVALIQSLP
jgi:hypothetical protein